MKSVTLVLLIVIALLVPGCSREVEQARSNPVAQDAPKEPQAKQAVEFREQQVSLKDADDSQSIAEAADRKIIKHAELTIEVDSPSETQHKIVEFASLAGGFVVNSETKRRQGNDQSLPAMEVKLVVRVPATQFDHVVSQIRNSGKHIMHDNVTGQDVTEEFIDLEARMKTQKALETQFLEIMKQAHQVEDALEVQRQIAEVRSGIERLEGRKRFLENRASLSNISVSLQTPTVIVVNTSGFGRSVKDAVSSSLDMATGILLLLIRLVIVSIPLLIFIVLPGALLARYFIRRARRHQMARELESIAATD